MKMDLKERVQVMGRNRDEYEQIQRKIEILDERTR